MTDIRPPDHSVMMQTNRDFRLASLNGCAHGLDGRCTLLARMHLEAGGAPFVRIITEQDFLEVAQRRRRGFRLEILTETPDIVADETRIVVNHEHAVDRGVMQRRWVSI